MGTTEMRPISCILGLTLSSVVALASANAADMYRAPEGAGGYKDGPAYVGVNWSGFYVGAHVGGAWGGTDTVDVSGYNTTGEKFQLNGSGVFGGGQLGYNFQRGNILFGIEGDIGGMDLSGSKIQPTSPGGDTKASLGSGVYGDVTGRIGVLVQPRALVYAKGGVAFFDADEKVVDSCVTPPCGGATLNASNHDTLVGWTIGAGAEYALTPSWSLKAEYQYFDFGQENVTGLAGGTESGTKTYDFKDLTVNTVKVGVNYHVGSGYEPLK